MSSISLLSLNIEHSKHLDVILPFLKQQKPDVVTMQECMEYDIPLLEHSLDMQSFFTPRCIYAKGKDQKEGLEGQAIFAKEFVSKNQIYYAGEYDPPYRFTENSLANIERLARALSYIEFKKDNDIFSIATTHFTWTPEGAATETQRKDAVALLDILLGKKEFVLTGDFNAPRRFGGKPGEIFSMFSARYTDNIPEHYETSIDISKHYAGKTHAHQLSERMVDGLFTTPGYVARNVELHSGVSDHMAVTAAITKV